MYGPIPLTHNVYISTLVSLHHSHSHSSIVQGADWYYGPERPYNGTFPVNDNGNPIDPPPYMRYSALATALAAFVFFVLYLVYQVCVCSVCVVCV